MDTLERKKLGQILCEKGFLNQSQLEHALREQKKREGEIIGRILLELGYITEAQLEEALGFQKSLV